MITNKYLVSCPTYRVTLIFAMLTFWFRREGKDLLSIYSDKIVGNVEGLERDDPARREENRLLRNLIDNLSNVETFSVTFDGAESRYKGHLCMADCYDVVSFGIVMDTILHGLGSQAFQHLTDLRLALPGTHDIGKLAAGIPDNVKQQLKHLYLEVVDESGPGGSLGLSFFDGPSNLQAQYPNQDYQDEVWAFIASCNNLESLGLHCTHCLSLERLNWKPGPNFRGQSVSVFYPPLLTCLRSTSGLSRVFLLLFVLQTTEPLSISYYK